MCIRNGRRLIFDYCSYSYLSAAACSPFRISFTSSSGAVTRINSACCMANSFISNVGTRTVQLYRPSFRSLNSTPLPKESPIWRKPMVPFRRTPWRSRWRIISSWRRNPRAMCSEMPWHWWIRNQWSWRFKPSKTLCAVLLLRQEKKLAGISRRADIMLII